MSIRSLSKCALAQINPTIGALAANREKIVAYIEKGRRFGATLIVFPELALSGYPPEDLLLLPSFIEEIQKELNQILPVTKGIAVIVGTVRKNPLKGEKGLYNSAALIEDGELMGFQDKVLLPDYDVFSERRYFEPGGKIKVWNIAGKRIGITICEDIWQHADAVEYTFYSRDPVVELSKANPDFVVNLSASPYYAQRHTTRLGVCSKAAKTLQCPLLFCNQVGGNDSLIFDGYSLHTNKRGELVQHAKGFEEDILFVDFEKEYDPLSLRDTPVEDLYRALVLGVRDYFHKLGFTKACFGLSGGIDSALVACIAKEALGRENLLALSLPSRYTTLKSQEEAREMAQNSGITLKEISIEGAFESFLQILEPYFAGKAPDVTEENLQARIRGMLLMAFSNKFGYILLGTSNKSEMAMGYATLYGDLCGGLGVLTDVSKNQVYALANWINRDHEIIPHSILEKSPSAELREGQKDSDTLPSYKVIDAILSDYIEYHRAPEEIAEAHLLPLTLVKELVRKIHLNEYKRRQAPPGLRVTRRSFSIGRRFPIVQHWNV